MSIVNRAIVYLRRLVARPDRAKCPRCGSTIWKKHATYRRGKRCLDELDLNVGIQRYYCKNRACRATWSERPAWLFPRRWYGRDVIRKSLDLCLDQSTSWRELAELLLGEITGGGRALRWAPWRRPKAGAERVRLSHTTPWRWFKMAATRASETESKVGRYAGLFSGVLATDESWGWVREIIEGIGRKASFGIQALVDGKNRLVLGLRRLKGQTEEDLRQGFESLASVGVLVERLRVILSDGLGTYDAVLEMLNLGRIARQRSVFHLWRTVAGDIEAFRAKRGNEAAEALREGLRRVWNAGSERAAVVALYALTASFGSDPLARRIVDLVRSTFVAATYHLKGSVPGLGRTSNVVEWLWRRFKRRMRLLQLFMSDESPDEFLALFELYVNFHRYQLRRERKRKYPYAGRCPLEIAGEVLEIEFDDQRRVASWMDALGI